MSINVHPFLEDLTARFHAQANPEIAQGQAAYLKNHFVFLGIPKPQVARLHREVCKAFPLPDEESLITLLELLWLQEVREFHYAALLLAEKYRKLHSPAMMPMLKRMACSHQWWDSIDPLAVDLIGPLAARDEGIKSQVVDWIESDDFWLRRVALLFQLKYKAKTDVALLFSLCEQVMHEKEFFIRKAIGWALREYAKTHPDAVWEFAQRHRSQLSGLSYREATRRIQSLYG